MIRIREIHTDTLSCEPILRRMPNGELLCVCQCGGPYEPHPDNRVYVFHSTDNGETWSEKKSIYPECGIAVYCTEVSVFEGVVTAYLTLHTGRFLDWKCIMMKSYDNGYTWRQSGAPPFLSEYTFIRGMLVCKDGTQLIPYQYYPVTKEEHDRILFEEYPDKGVFVNTRTPYCESGVLISKDHGKTYERFTACKMSMDEGWIWSEPTLAELSDGTITMLMRKCRSGWLWRCDSKDGGKTWSEVENAGIPNPSNKPKLIPMENWLIGLINVPNPVGQGERYPLELWISDDDMKSWKYKKSLIGERASYSYADGFYENGHILFSIEKNRKSILFFDVDIHEII